MGDTRTVTVWNRLRELDDPLASRVLVLAAGIREHPLWRRLTSLAAVRVFMEHHVWAVWDFMSLLKSIQAEVAPAAVPWVPPLDAAAAHLVNEIAAGEEGDEGPDGQHASHFEVYITAMDEAGVDTSGIRSFVRRIRDGELWDAALDQVPVPSAAREFVRSTLAVCGASLPERVAAFALGREEIIPVMFADALQGLPERSRLTRFVWYLERHVAVDGERHGPLAAQLFERVCLADKTARSGGLRAAEVALQCRIALWDAVIEAVACLGAA